MLNGLPVFCDEEFAGFLDGHQTGAQKALTKQVGGWTITLFADSIELLWLEPGKFQSSSPLLTIIFRHWFDEPGIFINNCGSTREQLMDIILDSRDTELQNFFLFNQII